ncbi:sensor histidine kinase [Oceanobacillus halotolerans]|uniref:sensor histidine kinase n=1 Tax=Oceanobacillus halotolerans TaxID=2663380 RepID=UPI0013D9EEDA|nr:sensor histidine kinase [Oceanobacillus halotolerans]
MIKDYLRERRSWIILVLSLQILSVIIAYLDATVPLKPIIYIVFLSLIIFLLFLVIRYPKETSFYKSLGSRINNLDLTSVQEPESPFEIMIAQSMEEQTEQLQQLITKKQVALEQEKDEILSWIHEIKTPLSTINLLIDRVEDKEVKTQLMFEWLRVHLLLDQQLHQKRISSIENDLHIEKVSLEPTLFEEIRTLQSWCIQKGIGFDVKLQKAEVLSDTKWLSFILRQILTNAVKYSEASEIEVTSFEQDNKTFLTIKNSGIGIDPKDLPRIFEKGFTSTGRHQDRNATGMGLYLAKKVANALLINIEVDSTLGKGTTFTLKFPQKNTFLAMTSM